MTAIRHWVSRLVVFSVFAGAVAVSSEAATTAARWHTTSRSEHLTIAFGSGGGCFVSDKIKEAITGNDFIGPTFRETAFDIKEIDEEELDFEIFSGVVWELENSVVLPKLANVHQFVHVQGEPFTGDYSRWIAIKEEPFAGAVGEFHYRERELRAVEALDLARTFEFHNKQSHTLVASQRFYRFCRELDLPIRWQPVRIDPG